MLIRTIIGSMLLIFLEVPSGCFSKSATKPKLGTNSRFNHPLNNLLYQHKFDMKRMARWIQYLEIHFAGPLKTMMLRKPGNLNRWHRTHHNDIHDQRKRQLWTLTQTCCFPQPFSFEKRQDNKLQGTDHPDASTQHRRHSSQHHYNPWWNKILRFDCIFKFNEPLLRPNFIFKINETPFFLYCWRFWIRNPTIYWASPIIFWKLPHSSKIKPSPKPSQRHDEEDDDSNIINHPCQELQQSQIQFLDF